MKNRRKQREKEENPLKIIELTCTIDKQGGLKIPAHILREMGITSGDSVRLAYLSGGEAGDSRNTYRELMVTPSGIAAAMGECEPDSGEFQIPAELLAAAHIPLDSDISITCVDGAIIIGEAELFALPDELSALLDDLGIDPENVRVSFEGGDEDE